MNDRNKLRSCKQYLTTDFRQIRSHHRIVLQPTTLTKKRHIKSCLFYKTYSQVPALVTTRLRFSVLTSSIWHYSQQLSPPFGKSFLPCTGAAKMAVLFSSSAALDTIITWTAAAEEQMHSLLCCRASSKWPARVCAVLNHSPPTVGDLKPGSSELQLFPFHLCPVRLRQEKHREAPCVA